MMKSAAVPAAECGRRQKSLWFQQGKYFYRARNASVWEALTPNTSKERRTR